MIELSLIPLDRRNRVIYHYDFVFGVDLNDFMKFYKILK